MGESMDELLNAEFKEAFDEFDKVAASFKDVIYQFGPLGMTFVTATPTLGCLGSSHIEEEADRTILGGPSRHLKFHHFHIVDFHSALSGPG